MENPLDDAETMKLDENKNIIELGKSPASYADIEGQYIGLIKISAKAIAQVVAFYNSLDKTKLYDGKDFNDMYMTSFLQMIIDNLMPVRAELINGGWIEIDCEDDMKCTMV